MGKARARVLDGVGSLSEEALERFVYIVGLARSGTSVLRDAVAIHDNILMLPGMTHFMNQVWRYRKKVHLRLLRQIFQLPQFYRETDVIRSLEPEKGRELQRHIDEASNSGDLKRMWKIYPLVYGLDQENRKKPDEVLCWGDKANDFYRIGAVRRAFARGKFIFIVRDPRGAVSSMAIRMGVKEEARFDPVLDEAHLIRTCISWRNMTQRMLRFLGHNRDRALLIKFEDFLVSPTKKLNEIFEFVLGVSMPEEEITRRLEALGYGATNDPADVGKGISERPLERWKTKLNPKQVDTIGTLTGETARKVGYFVEGSLSAAEFLKALERTPAVGQKVNIFSKLVYLEVLDKFIRPINSSL